MANTSTSTSASAESLPPKLVFAAAALCLLLGLGLGYASRGMQFNAAAAAAPSAHAGNPHVPTLADMKQMADRQAAPLLEKLKSSPGDSALLAQVATIYHSSHQFKEAAAYYDRAVHADPENAALRNRLASSLYRSGDVDGALAQLNHALAHDPGDANSLFNLGMIRLQGKGDGNGALAAWRQLLKSNPRLDADRKAEVQKLMADVLTNTDSHHPANGGTHP